MRFCMSSFCNFRRVIITLLKTVDFFGCFFCLNDFPVNYFVFFLSLHYYKYMIRKIIKGYGTIFSSIGKISLLLILCAVLGGAFVFPLWKFATAAPEIYTAAALSIIFFLVLFLLIKRIKKNGIKNFLIHFSKILVTLAGISGCICFVIYGKRIFALISVFMAVLLYGIISFGIASSKKTELANEEQKTTDTAADEIN